eukprot:359032-Chlamydomonas_euryale.AAC.3
MQEECFEPLRAQSCLSPASPTTTQAAHPTITPHTHNAGVRPSPPTLRPQTSSLDALRRTHQPQPYVNIAAAMIVPAMLPRLVWAFHTPMMSPRLPLPLQLATTDTTDGQPVDWNSPAQTDMMM